MCEQSQPKKYYIDMENLPSQFPTHRHDPKFWESLGRTVATFGFLEEILLKAIFALEATSIYDESEIDAEIKKFQRKVEKSLSDPLGDLIDSYEKSVRERQETTVENLKKIVEGLRRVPEIRNVLCHGSWNIPNCDGGSVPFFVNRKGMKFETAVDISFLEQTQKEVAMLACDVMNTVTQLGYQFPGTQGPGKSIGS